MNLTLHLLTLTTVATPEAASSLLDKIVSGASFGLSALLVLAVLIVVHEYGHFISARMVGVRVDKFSIGFGSALYSRVYNGVEYIVGWIPLGGYVKFYGDEFDADNSDDPEHFLNQAVWKRWIIVFAGPFFNFALAVAIFILVGLAGVPTPTMTVEELSPDAAAAVAGLAPGDTVVAVDGAPVSDWLAMAKALEAKGKRPITLEVTRDNRPEKIVFTPDFVGRIGVIFSQTGETAEPVIGDVAPGRPALAAGFLPGDTIVEIGGVATPDIKSVVDHIKNAAGAATPVTVSRNGARLILTVTPTSELNIGFFPTVASVHYGPIDATVYGFQKTWEGSERIFSSMLMLIKREIPANQLAGPIGIMKIAGDAASAGFVTLLNFIALISINLGILNLLPIPILDGGHLVFFTLEGLMGRPVNLRMQEMAQQFGIVALISLMAFAFYNDIVRLLS